MNWRITMIFLVGFYGNCLSVLAQCDSLATQYQTNNGQDGIMFDVAIHADMAITGFDCNLSNFNNPSYDFEIYYKQGSHVGHTQNPSSWVLLGSVQGVSGLGSNLPTPIPILLSLELEAGDTVAFYITDTVSQTTIDYTNGTEVGLPISSNSSLTIMEGTGKHYPFEEDYPPRIPNITIYHECCPRPSIEISMNSCSSVQDGELLVESSANGPLLLELSSDSTFYSSSSTPTSLYIFNDLNDGQYWLRTTDSTGCVTEQQINIDPALIPDTVEVTMSVTNSTDSIQFEEMLFGVGSYHLLNEDSCAITALDVIHPDGIMHHHNSTIKLYPNPSHGVVHVSAESNLSILRFAILDVQGRLIQEVQIPDFTFWSFTLPDKKGVYLIRSESEKGISTNRVFKL